MKRFPPFLAALSFITLALLASACNRDDTSTNALEVSTERLGVEFRVPMPDSVLNAFATRNGLRLLRHRPSGTYEFELDRSVVPSETTATLMAQRLLATYPDTVHFAAATGGRVTIDDSLDWWAPPPGKP